MSSAMDKSELEYRCNCLRQELKVWEKTFSLQHDGRKAGRDDIKADVAISQRYKEYHKLRDILSGKPAPQTPSKRTSRKADQNADKTPKAQSKTFNTTPLKRKRDSGVDMLEASESASEFLSPQGPTMIGPTPQRDGIVLGLFDLLPAETPSKRRAVLVEVSQNILQTPTKTHGKAESETSVESRQRGGKTPLSTGKRFLLDKFVTPQKRKRDEEGTPTSALRGFSTPAFLRRDTILPAVDEDNEPTPRPAPWKRRGLGRSLSSMIQSLKKQEEDRLDEEADIMRELEMEAEGIPIPKKAKVTEILVEDSQATMPLGPDGAVESDGDEDENEAEDGLDQNGKPRRIWKKRGQKRQTRRVIMRPNFTKPKPPPSLQVQEGENEENSGVPETQPNPDYANDQDFSEKDQGSDYASDDSHTPKKRKTQPRKSKEAAKTQPTQKRSTEDSVKTATRKIKATAHANYRKLKIKSKGGNGGKGRFGRRR